jgi:hypothetical protein
MYCPNCGNPDQNPNAYCRRCGLWLVDQKSGSSHPRNAPEDRMKVMIVFNGLSALFALVSAIVLYATYLGKPEAKWSIYVAGAFCSVIAVHQTISFFFALSLLLRRRQARMDAARSTGSIEDKIVLPLSGAQTGQIIDAPSVTEKTTELMDTATRLEGSNVSQER